MLTRLRLTPRALLLLPLTALACRSQVTQPIGVTWHRVVGLIDNGGVAGEALVVPDTVRAGVPFTAAVATFGSSCIHPDGADLQVGGLLAAITPYDSVPSQPPFCVADIRAFPRSVGLLFTSSGSGVVRLHGRGFDGDLTLERTVIVRP